MLLNLVGNAIKFTDTGEVVIKARRRQRALYARRCAIPGRASTPSDQAKIFEEFQQADSSSTKKKGGTGLGLSIAKRIVEYARRPHLGRSSEPGKGSTFFINVPINVEQQVGHA